MAGACIFGWSGGYGFLVGENVGVVGDALISVDALRRAVWSVYAYSCLVAN